jgi:putative serine protease PepD
MTRLTGAAPAEPVQPPEQIKCRDGKELRMKTLRVGVSAAIVSAASLLLAACGPLTSTATGSSTTPTPQASASPSVSALQDQFVNIVKQVSPAVVEIQSGNRLGSGIIFDTGGDIVTNNHVVDGATNIDVVLADGTHYAAEPVGSSPANDLAVLHISATGLTPATFADSSQLAVGDIALALGNPLGLQGSVTQGIVSALGRNVPEDNGVTLQGAIQTSAEINPGNSGGALVNLQGQVIGIPTLAAVDPQLGNGAAPGIGFAIPSNTVHGVANQLLAQR